MKLLPKIVTVLVVAFVLPALVLGILACLSIARLGARATHQCREALLAARSDEILALTREKAAVIDRLLQEYVGDVEQLATLFGDTRRLLPLVDLGAIRTPYPAAPGAAPLPGFGIVDAASGAYADFDRKGAGCPWMPRPTVRRAAGDAAAAIALGRDLHHVMFLSRPLKSFETKHRGTLDLAWIVLTNGITNVYPPYEYRSLLAGNPGLADKDEAAEDYVRLLNPQHNPERAIRWLEPYCDPFKSVWMTSCVAPLYDGDTFVGTAGMDILLATVTAMVVEIGIGDGSYAFLLSREGGLVAAPDRALNDLLWDAGDRGAYRAALSGPPTTNTLTIARLTDSPRAEQQALARAMTAGQSCMAPGTWTGDPSLVAFAPIPSAGWSLGIVVPRTRAMAGAERAAATIHLATVRSWTEYAALGCVIVLLSIMVGTYVDYRLVRPLAQLRRQVADVHWDNLEFPRTAPRATDEIGDLHRKFTEMITDLRNAKQEILSKAAELEALNAQLEHRVQARTAELLAANQQLDAFAYSVSHDLRGPLHAIAGFAGLLERSQRGRLDAEGELLLQRVQGSVERMNRLIDALLAFSRLGRKEIRHEPIDMATLAREVGGELRAQAGARIVDLVIGALPPATGDAAMVRQVWTNLLQNAFKFTRHADIARIQVEGSREDNASAYRVRDNGVGFDAHQAGRLFTVFQRLHTQGEFEGTGAGLAIVKRIVERHGGRVWAESTPGQGATFGFVLPDDAVQAGPTTVAAAT